MPPFKRYSKFGEASEKSKKIEEAMERKEKGIKRYTDAKSLSIAVSSAFNGSAELATALVNTNKLEIENYWSAHKTFYEEYLERFLGAQEEASKDSTGALSTSSLKTTGTPERAIEQVQRATASAEDDLGGELLG